MQAAHAADQDRRVRFKLINFAGFIGVTDGAVHRVAQVDLTFDHFVPVRRQRIFKIRHKDFHIGIQRIDHHFTLYRPGDLDASVLQILRNAAYRPVTFTNGSSFRNKVRQLSVINVLLLLDTCGQ